MVRLFALIVFTLLQTTNVFAQNNVGYGISFAPLVEKLIGGVVNISTTHSNKNAEAKPEIISANEFINNYFVQDEGGYISLGSGFLIDPQGYIVTNAHVIDKANEVVVKTSDNIQYNAKIIGIDDMTDLALIKIDADKQFPFVKIGDSDKLKVGDWILAIGNPFGLGGSVTAGIVSAKSRDIDAGSYDNFIQTDASINQGSSGGPMFNMSGEVVGINTALYSTSGLSMGIGFATPINLSKFVIEQLKLYGKVERGWLGLKVMDNTQTITLSEKQTYAEGVVVSSVIPDSPSEKAKIQAGDIIISINGKDIKNAKNFSRTIAESKINSEIVLRIWQNEQTKDISLKIAKMPETKKEISNKDKKTLNKIPEGYISSLGIIIKNEKDYVIIEEILADSDAKYKGVKSGDIIKKINDKNVNTVKDVKAYVDYALKADKDNIKLDILSNELPQSLKVSIINND